MKIKKLIFVITMLFSIYSFGQRIDSRLSAVYSPEELNSMNPNAIKYFNFYVKNSYRIVNFTTTKPIDYKILYKINPKTKEIISEKINYSDIVDFNPYLFSCETAQDKATYYKIGNTGKLLIMLSREEIEKEFRNKTKK